jgi:hypothetical protein
MTGFSLIGQWTPEILRGQIFAWEFYFRLPLEDPAMSTVASESYDFII